MRLAWVALAAIASVLMPGAALRAQTALPAMTFTPTPATPTYPPANYKPVIIIDPATMRQLLATPSPRPRKSRAKGGKPAPRPTNTYETFSTIKN